MRARSLLGLVAVLALGCGSKKLAPVSGTVTLNGKPLVGATVTFDPIAEKGSIEAGHASMGKTDEEGRFTLQTTKGENGARIGKHRVSISVMNQQAGDTDERPPRGGWPVTDQVPAEYNTESKLTFEVPPGGTDSADFPLKSPETGNKVGGGSR
jgi:hypothetical protein